LALGREPAPEELRRSREFLDNSPMTEFALAIFNLNEFVFVD